MLRICDTKTEGKGLFVTRKVPRGTVLTEYGGATIHVVMQLMDAEKRASVTHVARESRGGCDRAIDGWCVSAAAVSDGDKGYLVPRALERTLGAIANAANTNEQLTADLVWFDDDTTTTKPESMKVQPKAAFLVATRDLDEGTEVRWSYVPATGTKEDGGGCSSGSSGGGGSSGGRGGGGGSSGSSGGRGGGGSSGSRGGGSKR